MNGSESVEKKRLLLTADKLQVFVGEKQILHDVSAVAKSGSLMAIMGPSGSGKTTFMNTISGRMPLTSGEIKLNGRLVSARMRKTFGYVTQMDVFFPMLTLRQTVQFAARVKLPDSMSAKQREERITEVVSSLELEKCMDTMIGSFFMPGLSGGEKKRANIACELLRNPDVLLLDEPTSGLDSSLAMTLIELLGRWATKQGKIAIMSIHQPSSQIFHHFGDLLLLTEGHMSYFGRQDGMVDYFESIGVPFRKHWNPADFMLEIVKATSESKQLIIEKGASFSEVVAMRKAATVTSMKSLERRQLEEDEAAAKDEAEADGVDVGHVNPAFADEVASGSADADGDYGDDEEELSERRQVSWGRQLQALVIRGFFVSRARFLSPFPLIQTAFVALISSLLWFQLARTEERIGDLLGCIFFLVITLSFAPLFEAIISFTEDIMIVRHERRAGMYQIGAYYASKMLTEMPLVVAVPFLSLTIVFWTVGLSTGVFYLPFVLGILTNAMACQGIGIFVGLLTDSPKTNLTIAFIFMLFSLLLGGFFNADVPVWLVWAKWLSFVRYCYHYCLLLVMQSSPNFRCAESVVSKYATCLLAAEKNATLEFPSSEIISNFPDQFLPVWANYLLMFCFLAGFRIAGYLWLRFMKKV